MSLVMQLRKNIMFKSISIIVSLIILANCDLALADEKKIFLTPYVGVFDTLRRDHKLLAGLEARYDSAHQYIKPKVGIFVNSKNSNYLYTGFNVELPIYHDKLFISPGFAVGAYSKHRGKNLGGTLEFYSNLELSYKISYDHRIGINFGHISNASIYKKNPGTENLLLTYSIPISF